MLAARQSYLQSYGWKKSITCDLFAEHDQEAARSRVPAVAGEVQAMQNFAPLHS